MGKQWVAAAHFPDAFRRYDESNHERFPVGDVNKRAFTYFVLTGARFAYASAIRLVVLKFILSMSVRGEGTGFEDVG